MKKIVFIFSLLLISTVVFAKDAVNFKIVVNQSSPDTTLTKNEVSKIFLKKVKKWKTTGEKIFPVDLIEESNIRENFSDIILNKKISSVKAYWQKQIFSGRGVPPPEKKSQKQVLQYVEDNKGAIGYVAKGTDVSKYKVKVIEINDIENESKK